MQKVLRTVFPIYRFSSKKAERIAKKIEQVQQSQSTNTLDSVADQNEFTDDQLLQLVENRKQLVRELVQQNETPKEVKYVTLATLSPLLLLSGATLFSCMDPTYAIYSGQLMHASLKYAAINLAFQAGIHWGFGMSQHECQLDWLNSSSEARLTFFLASIPIIGSVLIAQYFLYGDNDFNIKSVSACIGLVLLNLIVTGLDIRSKRYAPGWYLKNKAYYTLGFHVALVPLVYSAFIYGDNFKNKPNIYRVQ